MLLALLPALLLTPSAISSLPNPSFSGVWKQDNARCIPQRKGDVTLVIDHHDPDLTVETTVVRSSGPLRHALQRYTTNGKTTVSTGADGDEFHTSITWRGPSLAFSVEEHEDGRILMSKETWTMIDNGSALQRDREALTPPGDGDRKQTLIYQRQSPGPDGK